MKQDYAPIGPTAHWREPLAKWVDIIERYIAFVQMPSWRVNAFKLDGSLPPSDAALLRTNMRRVVENVASRRSVSAAQCDASMADLDDLLTFHGAGAPKAERCSKRLHWHFQRAFLFNRAGYSCRYCRRTAWNVYDEDTDPQPRRTLRFEIDHLVPKRKTADRTQFDSGNLVVACRSCNTIKGEMAEDRFLIELRSLGCAVYLDRNPR